MRRAAHGTYARYCGGCHCRPCRDASAKYRRELRRRVAYGAYRAPHGSRDRLIRHLRMLESRNVTLTATAAAAGVHPETLRRLVNEPNRSPHRMTLARVLSVEPHPDLIPGGLIIPSTASVRRLRALNRLGWSCQRLAQQIGCNDATIQRLTAGGATVKAHTAARIHEIYNALWEMEPTYANPFEHSAIRRTRNRAMRMGWPPPMAWDDATIDDPTADPGDEWITQRVNIEDVRFLLAQGETREQIARRFGLHPNSVYSTIYRAKRSVNNG